MILYRMDIRLQVTGYRPQFTVSLPRIGDLRRKMMNVLLPGCEVGKLKPLTQTVQVGSTTSNYKHTNARP